MYLIIHFLIVTILLEILRVKKAIKLNKSLISISIDIDKV